MILVIMYKEKSYILAVCVIITVQSSDTQCWTGFVSVGKSNTHFDIDRDGVLVGVSGSDSALQQVVAASLRLASLTLVNIAF